MAGDVVGRVLPALLYAGAAISFVVGLIEAVAQNAILTARWPAGAQRPDLNDVVHFGGYRAVGQRAGVGFLIGGACVWAARDRPANRRAAGEHRRTDRRLAGERPPPSRTSAACTRSASRCLASRCSRRPASSSPGATPARATPTRRTVQHAIRTLSSCLKRAAKRIRLARSTFPPTRCTASRRSAPSRTFRSAACCRSSHSSSRRCGSRRPRR